MAAFDTLIFYVFLAVFTFVITSYTVKKKAKAEKLRQVLNFLGLKPFSVKNVVADSIILLVLILVALSVEALLLSFVSLDDSQKVEMVISSLSLPAIIVAATLGPFAEELFFRGFLQKYAGVIITSALFALLHYSFGSLTEVIGAFTAGLILGYWVKYRNASLWPAIIAHAGYNLVSIMLVPVAFP